MNQARGTNDVVGAITTASGLTFDAMADEPAFDIGDIAHALGMCVRYNGHVSRFYSVAEHCVLVSKIMEHELIEQGAPISDIVLGATEGLFHDALEAYLSDVPAPFKQFLPDYKRFDDMLERKLRVHFGLDFTKSQLCKRADWIALFLESDVLMTHQGSDYADPLNIRKEALANHSKQDQFRIHCWNPARAKNEYFARYVDLSQLGIARPRENN